jgi:hypothetical protein
MPVSLALLHQGLHHGKRNVAYLDVARYLGLIGVLRGPVRKATLLVISGDVW